MFGDAVDEHRGGQGLHDLAGHAAVLDEVAQREREDALRVHELAVAVARADAIGVAVGGEAGVEVGVEHGALHLVDPRRDGLGVQAAEAGVGIGVDLDDLGAEAREYGGEVALAGAVERVDHDVEVGAAR